MQPKILIVDDQESILRLFKLFLSDDGYEIFTATDCSSAFEIICRAEPDLIITDIVLESSSGIEILQHVKEKELHSPVVMITAVPDIETASEAVRLGAYDYLPKPVRRDTFLRVIDQALKKKALLDEKKQIELEKEHYRRHLDAIFSSLMDPVLTVDNRMTIIEANDAVKKVCGLMPSAIVGKQFDEISFQCEKPCITVLKKTVEEKGTIREYRVECRHGQRPGQVALLTSSPLKDRNNKFLGAVLVIRDITAITELKEQLKEQSQFHSIIGKNKKMRELYRLLKDLSGYDTTVLITGESGTGKELAARALHDESSRSSGPLVTLNCTALAENLLESELFGHVKGAFTGAVRENRGRFQMADGGTLFLDEIGDISPRLQLKLLRALQENEFERVGDATPIRVDVRVVAATNRDLREQVRSGAFREDLYYRLKVVELSMPALREKLDDIPLLVDHFRTLFNKRFKKEIDGFSGEALALLMQYPWPGNVRELEHAVEHAFILCHNRTISVDHLPLEIREHQRSFPSGFRAIPVESEEILDALKRSGGNKAKAARLLGISRQTIYRKIKEHRIVAE